MLVLRTIRLNKLASPGASASPLSTMLPAVRIVNCCPPVVRTAHPAPQQKHSPPNPDGGEPKAHHQRLTPYPPNH